MSGALSGMWFGLFVGVMLSFFSPTGGYFSIVTSVLMGAAFFMLFGIVTYAMQRGKRDFTSTSQVVATNYDVVVAFEASHEARRMLQQLPMTTSDASAGAAAYGQRGYQNQPFQQPGTAGPAAGNRDPQRPAGWNDPYGQRTPEAGNQPPPAPTRPEPRGRTAGCCRGTPPAPRGSPARRPLPGPARRQAAVRCPRGGPAQTGAEQRQDRGRRERTQQQ